ncbi:MAG TPA: HEAT repeat domain-containing protein, partial [Armatimonadota bacterium]
GKLASLIALVQAGDNEGMRLLRTLVLTDASKLPPADLANAIRVIGNTKDASVLNTIRLMLYNEDAGVVDAAIEALGNTGDKRVVKELLPLLDKAELDRAITLSRTLTKLGAGQEIRRRYLPQLRLPTPGVREKAALMLAATGDPSGWPSLQLMLTKKEAPYYPLVLTVMGSLPSEESTAFVIQALSGNEQEQIAALQSINLLPQQEREKRLTMVLRDKARPVAVRSTCIAMLVKFHTPGIDNDLRNIASALEGEDPALRAQALIALPAYGLLAQPTVREMVRARFDSEDENIARAARLTLLNYAIDALKPVAKPKGKTK